MAADSNHRVRLVQGLSRSSKPLASAWQEQDVGSHYLKHDRKARGMSELHGCPAVRVRPGRVDQLRTEFLHRPQERSSCRAAVEPPI